MKSVSTTVNIAGRTKTVLTTDLIASTFKVFPKP